MKTNLPFLPVAVPSIGDREAELMNDAVRSGWISSLGPYVEKFEKQFAAFCKTKHCVALANGTVALHLALVTLGIGLGDEVISPALTFVATANTIRHCGATPVFVDSDPDHWCLDINALEKAISPKTRAIIPVHLYGHPVEMGPLMKLARKHNLKVIEDVAEAHGAEYKGKKAGSLGDCGAFSFYGNKLITTGEGGALVTDSDEIEKKARFLKDHAMSKEKKYYHEEVGYNYRLTNPQAALGVAQLERYDELSRLRSQYLSWYREELAGFPKIRFNPQASWAKSVVWLICLDLREYGEDQVSDLQGILRENGIDTRPFFIPMNELPPHKNCKTFDAGGKPGCPVARKLSRHGINVPSGHGLERSDVKRICDVIKSVLKN